MRDLSPGALQAFADRSKPGTRVCDVDTTFIVNMLLFQWICKVLSRYRVHVSSLSDLLIFCWALDFLTKHIRVFFHVILFWCICFK